MRRGLVPARDTSIGQRMINARAETLLEKPSFKPLVAAQRCLVRAGRVLRVAQRLQPGSGKSSQSS